MPEQIRVSEFIRESWDDYKSPTTSTFSAKMGHCKATVAGIEDNLDFDRSGLTKMKKSVKALYSSGNMHVSNESYLVENLKKLGNAAMTRENEIDIANAFLKFAVITEELSALMKNLMQNLNNILMFPLDNLMKGDLRGVKGDLKKPFDKACKEHDAKFNKIEKEKKQLAKEAGMVRSEVTGAEIAEEMEKERRMFQLQACEYLIKVNEIKTKKGVNLLEHLVEYYHAQTNYFQDGMKTIEHYKTYIDELVLQLGKVKQRQDNEKKQLVELRDALKSSITIYKELQQQVQQQGNHGNATPSSTHRSFKHSPPAQTGYSLHQLQGNKVHGCERSGFLLKKSEGVRKVWQRRRCSIKDGIMSISHSDVNKEPVKLNLLTCQVKLVPDDPGKKCFDLISSSKNRTYHFQAEDVQTMEEWISVLNNAKEAVLMKAFKETSGSETNSFNQSVRELTGTIIHEIRRMPGNNVCCDCGAPDPEWLSVNLGVLICLECCGVHREMGVHISRTQSIVIDHLGTSQLLLARTIGNMYFNEIMEDKLDLSEKPTPEHKMDKRKTFIRNKYEKKKYVVPTTANEEQRLVDLKLAIQNRDIFNLLQVYGEGVGFTEPLPDMENLETAVHLAIMLEDGASLHMVDFILQNSNCQYLDRRMRDGNTALHLCAQLNLTECMKLLLRLRQDLVDIENYEGQTALEIAKDRHYDVCVELLNHAIEGKTEMFENVNVEWNLMQEDHLYDNCDYSDDDLDSVHTPDRKSRSRPGSLVMPIDSATLSQVAAYRERSQTVDSNKMGTLPPPPPPQSNKPKVTAVPTSGTNTLNKKKAPAPPPPGSGPLLSSSVPPMGGGYLSGSGPPVLPSSAGPGTQIQGFQLPQSQYIHGHSRNPSDPGFIFPKGHNRSPSDPPPAPYKGLTSFRNPGLPGKLPWSGLLGRKSGKLHVANYDLNQHDNDLESELTFKIIGSDNVTLTSSRVIQEEPTFTIPHVPLKLPLHVREKESSTLPGQMEFQVHTLREFPPKNPHREFPARSSQREFPPLYEPVGMKGNDLDYDNMSLQSSSASSLSSRSNTPEGALVSPPFDDTDIYDNADDNKIIEDTNEGDNDIYDNSNMPTLMTLSQQSKLSTSNSNITGKMALKLNKTVDKYLTENITRHKKGYKCESYDISQEMNEICPVKSLEPKAVQQKPQISPKPFLYSQYDLANLRSPLSCDTESNVANSVPSPTVLPQSLTWLHHNIGDLPSGLREAPLSPNWMLTQPSLAFITTPLPLMSPQGLVLQDKRGQNIRDGNPIRASDERKQSFSIRTSDYQSVENPSRASVSKPIAKPSRTFTNRIFETAKSLDLSPIETIEASSFAVSRFRASDANDNFFPQKVAADVSVPSEISPFSASDTIPNLSQDSCMSFQIIPNLSQDSWMSHEFYTAPSLHVNARSPTPPPVPPKLPPKLNTLTKSNTFDKSLRPKKELPPLPGAKLVLPPPPEFRSENNRNNSNLSNQNNNKPEIPSKPETRLERPEVAPKPGIIHINTGVPMPAPRGSRTSTPTEGSASPAELVRTPLSCLSKQNGQSRSIDSIDSLDSCGSQPPRLRTSENVPVPTPRMKKRSGKIRRCLARYYCEADNDDELSFNEGEVIVIIKEEEDEWWEGYVEGHPERRGMFPATFVTVLEE